MVDVVDHQFQDAARLQRTRECFKGGARISVMVNDSGANDVVEPVLVYGIGKALVYQIQVVELSVADTGSQAQASRLKAQFRALNLAESQSVCRAWLVPHPATHMLKAGGSGGA